MRNLKSKLLGGLSMIIVCMTVFAGNAAASEDLKLNPDALTKVKNEIYGCYDFDGYWLPSNELFLGIGTEGCTFGELFDCVQGYGLECEWGDGTKDSIGFRTNNFYIGTMAWDTVFEIPEPAKVQEIINKERDNSQTANGDWNTQAENRWREIDNELKAYYQTNEWLQYQNACKEDLRSVKIYPNTELEAAFWKTRGESDFGFMETSMGSDEYREKVFSLEETQAIIDKVNFSNNISNIKPHGEKNGWLFEDEAWRYYENNVPITSSWKDIDGKRYYFKDDSSMAHSGLFEIDGNIYSFSVDGPVDLGWHIQNPGDGDHWYYFRNDSECFGAAMVGLRNSIEGDFFQYFFWTNGYTDQNGNSHPTGSLAIGNDSSDQWILKDGIPVYVADKDGHLYTNTEKELNGKIYRIDQEGKATEIIQETEFEKKIKEIEKLFPVNAHWKSIGANNPQSTTNGNGSQNQFDNSWQCMGFAKYLYYYVYGQKSTKSLETNSTSHVQIGDYVRIGGYTHSIFVTDIYKENGKVYWKVAREVWGNNNNLIKECIYEVISETTIKGITDGGREYTINAIRRADNELRRKVGLPDAPAF